jgi:hypothetical protein
MQPQQGNYRAATEADVGNLVRCDQDFHNGLLATCKCRCCAGAGKELGMQLPGSCQGAATWCSIDQDFTDVCVRANNADAVNVALLRAG